MYINNQFSVLGGYRSKEKTLKKKGKQNRKKWISPSSAFPFHSLTSIFDLNLCPQSLTSISLINPYLCGYWFCDSSFVSFFCLNLVVIVMVVGEAVKWGGLTEEKSANKNKY